MPDRERSTRRAARRRAQQAKAVRDQERAHREEEIEAALTDYYEAAGRVNQRMDAARRRADAVVRTAEQSSADDTAAARDAISRLRALLPVPEIAVLCGLTQRAVRDMLPASAESPDEPDDGEECRPTAGEIRDREEPGSSQGLAAVVCAQLPARDSERNGK
jgi:hypothetical protein